MWCMWNNDDVRIWRRYIFYCGYLSVLLYSNQKTGYPVLSIIQNRNPVCLKRFHCALQLRHNSIQPRDFKQPHIICECIHQKAHRIMTNAHIRHICALRTLTARTAKFPRHNIIQITANFTRPRTDSSYVYLRCRTQQESILRAHTYIMRTHKHRTHVHTQKRRELFGQQKSRASAHAHSDRHASDPAYGA